MTCTIAKIFSLTFTLLALTSILPSSSAIYIFPQILTFEYDYSSTNLHYANSSYNNRYDCFDCPTVVTSIDGRHIFGTDSSNPSSPVTFAIHGTWQPYLDFIGNPGAPSMYNISVGINPATSIPLTILSMNSITAIVRGQGLWSAVDGGSGSLPLVITLKGLLPWTGYDLYNLTINNAITWDLMPTFSGPIAQHVSESTDSIITINGDNWKADINNIVVNVDDGSSGGLVLSCTMTIPVSQIQCDTNPHAATGSLTMIMSLTFYSDLPPFLFSSTLQWADPVLYFVSPTIFPTLGGYPITMVGANWVDSGSGVPTTSNIHVNDDINNWNCDVTGISSSLQLVCTSEPHAATFYASLWVKITISSIDFVFTSSISFAAPTVNAPSLMQVPTLASNYPITLTGSLFSSDNIIYAGNGINPFHCTPNIYGNTMVCLVQAHTATTPMRLYVGIVYLGKLYDWNFLNVIQWSEPAVTAPVANQKIALSGNLVITVVGAKFSSSIANVVISVATVGTLSCSMTVAQTTVVCILPPHAATSNLALVATITYLSISYVFTFSNTIQWVAPTITSASPATLALGGGLVTLTGDNFGWSGSFYTGATTAYATASIVGYTNTQMTIRVGSQTVGYPLSSAPVTLKWAGPTSVTSGNILAFASPTITSASTNYLPHSGGLVTISGTYFGVNKPFYTSVALGNRMTGTIQSITDTSMVILFGYDSGFFPSGPLNLVLNYVGGYYVTLYLAISIY